jgi:hypothetical protein
MVNRWYPRRIPPRDAGRHYLTCNPSTAALADRAPLAPSLAARHPQDASHFKYTTTATVHMYLTFITTPLALQLYLCLPLFLPYPAPARIYGNTHRGPSCPGEAEQDCRKRDKYYLRPSDQAAKLKLVSFFFCFEKFGAFPFFCFVLFLSFNVICLNINFLHSSFSFLSCSPIFCPF